MKLPDMRVFVRVADLGSLSQAARALAPFDGYPTR